MSNSEIATSIGIIYHSMSPCKWKSCAFLWNDIAWTTFFLLSLFFFPFHVFFFVARFCYAIICFSTCFSTSACIYIGLNCIFILFDSFTIITWFYFLLMSIGVFIATVIIRFYFSAFFTFPHSFPFIIHHQCSR